MNVMPAARHLLSRLRSRRAAAAPEPADYGTAFGLELTYDDEWRESAAAPAASPAPSSPGWWRRLTGRRAAAI